MKRFTFFTTAGVNRKLRAGKRRLTVEALEDRCLLSGNVISGFVYVDANNNGLFDPGERPLPGVAVQLLNSANTVIGSTVTDATGAYSFNADGTISTAPTTLTESASIALTSTNWQQGLSIPQFDPTLGTLTGITITSAGTFVSDIKVENLDPTSSAVITGTDSGILTLTGPGLTGLVTSTSTSKTFNASAYDGKGVDFDFPSGIDFGTQTAPGSMVTSILSTSFSQYIGTGSVSLTDTATATSGATGGGNLVSNISTSASAQVTVVYTYIPSNALKPGKYTIKDFAPAGYLDGKLSSGGIVLPNSVGSHLIPVTLQNSDSTNNDFAQLVPASIAGFVYIDMNLDGRDDSGDPGVQGVTLTLTGSNDLGTVNLTTTTGLDGSYQFGNLRPGNYSVTETPPSGYLPGTENLGTVGLNADGIVGTNQFTSIVLASGNQGANYDFGEIKPTSVAGHVYSDLNDNGSKEQGEPGIGGTTITLIGVTTQGAPIVKTTTTAADGSYSFSPLLPGTYTLRETPPSGYLQGQESLGSAGGTVGDAQFTGITLTMGVPAINYDFAELLPGRLAGFVYLDSNDNGAKDPGESGIANVTVTLTGTDDHGASVNFSQRTLGDGSYQFSNLRPGTYTLAESPPGGSYLQGKDTIGSIGGIASVDVFSAIIVPAGAAGANYNFGELLPSSLAGFVYLDSNNNGAKDPGERGIAGVRVTLTGTDDRGSTVGISQNTAADGSYQFNGLRPGIYTLTETPPANYLQGKDAIGSIGGIASVDLFSSIIVPMGAAGINYNFGQQLPSSLSGFVFLDANNDGIMQPNESGIANVAITLMGTTDLGGSVSSTQYTGADGSYHFANLMPGNYTLSKTPPPAYIDGKESLGSAGGIVATDQFTSINLAGSVNGANYNFAELLAPTASGMIYSDFFSPNKTTFPPPDLNILSKLQFLSDSGSQTIDPTTRAQATWVNGVYETLLERPADAGGMMNWVALLHNGIPRGQVVAAIWNSPEHRTIEVDQFYETFFNRAADTAGQAFWVNELLSGMSESQVATMFVTSGEYAATHSSSQSYVLGLYANILGRSATNQEVAGWVQQLQMGTSRAAIAAAFLNSTESLQHIISNDYLNYLNRSVDPAGLQSWLAAIASGQATPASVSIAILASAEFYNDAAQATS